MIQFELFKGMVPITCLHCEGIFYMFSFGHFEHRALQVKTDDPRFPSTSPYTIFHTLSPCKVHRSTYGGTKTYTKRMTTQSPLT